MTTILFVMAILTSYQTCEGHWKEQVAYITTDHTVAGNQFNSIRTKSSHSDNL